MESIINTFHIDFKIIFAQIFNFGIVFVVLYIYALKPLNKLMKERSDKIVQEGKKEAENKKTSMLEKTKDEVAIMIENGKKNLENEKIKMVAQATEEISSLSVKIAEKILGNKIDESFDEKTMKELNKI